MFVSEKCVHFYGQNRVVPREFIMLSSLYAAGARAFLFFPFGFFCHFMKRTGEHHASGKVLQDRL